MTTSSPVSREVRLHAPARAGAGPLVVAAAVAAVLAAACGGGGKGAAGDSAAVADTVATTVGPENVVVVARDRVSSGPTLSGSLTPERSATLRAQVGGTVTAVLAEAGQAVRRGQTLARVETAGIAEQAASARAAVAAARGNYELAVRNAERNDRLLAAGAVAPQVAEQARTARDAARSQLSAAQAQLAGASTTLGRASVEAPFAGIVGTRSVSVGDVVAPGAELYTVVDPRSMELTGSVPADQLGQVRPGATLSFTVTGYPGREFTGRITRVAPVADPTTRQVQVIASVPNAGNRLVGGLFAQGRVASETREALVVPADAVDRRGVRPQVVRVRGGRAEAVPVEVGLTDEASERVEVRAAGGTALAQGDTLLRGAAQGLTAGTRVRVSAPNDRATAGGAVRVPASAGQAGTAGGGTGGGAPAQGSRTGSGS